MSGEIGCLSKGPDTLLLNVLLQCMTNTITLNGFKVLVVAVLMVSGLSVWGQRMPRALLITGNGNLPKAQENYPPWVHEFQNDVVVGILKDVVAIDTTADLAMLNDKTLQEYDLLISNSMFLAPSAAQLDAVYRFVSQGKSYLTLHCGILSFLNWSRYEEFIGGIFIGGPSTELETFPVITENWEFWGYATFNAFRPLVRHPVSRVVADFTIRDEMYYFQPSARDVQVIARAENHPVMWSHSVGEGKVMSLTLGHSRQAKSTAGYQQLLISGARWLLDYPLIEDLALKPLSTRTKAYLNYIPLGDVTHGAGVSYALVSNSNEKVVKATLVGTGIDVMVVGVGTATVRVSAANTKGLHAYRDFVITVVDDGSGNVASYHGNVATASSSDRQVFTADAGNTIDGDRGTRWSSTSIDPAWLVIDLQKVYAIRKVQLYWEDSFATEYVLQVSARDNQDWKTVAIVDHGDGETDSLSFDAVQARYVRVLGTKRARSRYGYSLYEVEVYK